ncbi:right-handed parallel beta-helix repeat-containing protein [Flavobacterium sp. N3904]|uniref:right-handed parallel beta-helix repeat-containing protein n=1 Tax=Flavobacterium sp. N3904 TaxID=2986835 RepID=UPI0022252E3F|nr:right-handed parallel beta-helix repeat-containing protein [Flavobacterium sp. N3904]
MKNSVILSFLFCVFLFFSFQIVKNQDVFVYKDSPEKYKSNKGNFGKTTLISKKMIDASYPIVKSLPVGYDTMGKTDYTDLIQSVLDTYNNVTFPGFPLLVNPKGLSLKSNSQIIFNKGAKLLMEPNSKQKYEVLRLHGVTNVKVYSPTIIGDREGHTGTTGEWGFGISIRGSQKIKIFNAVIKNCWGDGIYLGTTGTLTNSDILIQDCYLDNNRRNGISIISGINISISNTLISNTNGTAPMSGIDIEPNTNKEELGNIIIKDVITFNNKNEGILIALRGLYGKNNKDITVAINNHLDDNSGSAMGFAFPKENTTFKNIGGNIVVTNSVWKGDYPNLVKFHDNNSNFVTVKLVRPKALNKDDNLSTEKMKELKTKLKKGNNFLLTE